MADTLNGFNGHLGIVGAGKMGSSIFDYLFDLGFRITLVTGTPEKSEELRKKADKTLKRLFKQGVKSADEVQRLDNCISITTDYAKLRDADVVIEAVAENAEIKKEVLAKIFEVVPRTSLVATNSASITPPELACPGIDASRFFGLHFFFPVETTRAAELVRHSGFGGHNLEKAECFVKSIGVFTVRQDETNAFLMNVLAMPVAGEAFLLAKRVGFKLANRLASSEFFPSGPFYFLDQAGLGAMIESGRRYYSRNLFSGWERYSQLLCFMMLLNDAGGEGAGRRHRFLSGFIEYPHDLDAWARQEIFSHDCELADEDTEAMKKRFSGLLTAAFLSAVQNNLAEPDVLDEAWKRISGAAKGPIERALENGSGLFCEVASLKTVNRE